MFIHDLEFIDPLSQKDRKSNFAIRGGASAFASASTSTSDGEVFAIASAEATGDYTSSVTSTGARLISQNNYRGRGYITGYSTGYGAAYGVDRYGSVSKDRSTSTSLL